MNKINKTVNLILSGDKTINVCDIVKYISNKQQKESSNETNHSKNNS